MSPESDPGMLVSHSPENAHIQHWLAGFDTAFEAPGCHWWLPLVQNSARISCHDPGGGTLEFAHTESLPAAVRATQRSVGERVTFTWITFRDFNSMMKKAKSERKKRSVTCKQSHAPTPAA